MPLQNPAPDEISIALPREDYRGSGGYRPNQTDRASSVRALQGFGYRTIPVRPALNEVLG